MTYLKNTMLLSSVIAAAFLLPVTSGSPYTISSFRAYYKEWKDVSNPWYVFYNGFITANNYSPSDLYYKYDNLNRNSGTIATNETKYKSNRNELNDLKEIKPVNLKLEIQT